MYSNEHTLQDLLHTFYHQIDMDDAIDEMDVTRVYQQLVGDLIAKLTRQIKFEKGVLRVQLASPALRNELFYRRESLRQNINKYLNRNAVKEIQFC